jgi:hypothetical protein
MTSSIVRIDPPIPLMTPKGRAVAHFLIDTGVENDLQWVCFQDETGECWTWENAHVRARVNKTIGRSYDYKEKNKNGI